MEGQLPSNRLFPQKSISNADGQRISKTVDGVTTEFFYAGDILAGQKTGDNILMWIYDNNGAYIGFTYNGVEYYYVYNLQGDVEAITDATGAIVAKYMYDTWGYVEYEFNYNGSINIAEINPIRYRGYYYDSERGFYYLNSRYYDPFMCRFINADGYVTTGQGLTSFNMFAYCGNNPVNRADPTGQFWLTIALSIVATVVVAAIVTTVIVTVAQSKPAIKTEYDSIEEATEAWKDEHKKESQKKERGAFIYKKTDKKTKKTTYTTGRTYIGGENNVIRGFIVGYVSGGISSLFSSEEMVGFIHSHPQILEEGWHNDFPSDPDLFLLNLPGIDEVYIVPWDTCYNVPDIIKSSETEHKQ